MNIHPTSIVHPNAKIAEDVEIGPYTIVEEDVFIDEGTKIGAHCTLKNGTRIGKRCRIYAGVVIGELPQVKEQKSCTSFVYVGDENIIREYVTIHRSMYEGGATIIGNENFIMAGVHIAHDCKIGNKITITNYAGLTGHVTVEDGAFISGLVAIHQFVRIGAFSMIGGSSKVVQDVPPYLVVDGHPARVYGVNVTGLRRAGFSPQARALIKSAYRILYREGLNTKQALEKIRNELSQDSVIKHFLEFIEDSKRGICRGR